MTDKAEAVEREQFEAWLGKPLMNPAYPSHFNGKHARKQWEAWQASRAALKAQPAPTEAPVITDEWAAEILVQMREHMEVWGQSKDTHVDIEDDEKEGFAEMSGECVRFIQRALRTIAPLLKANHSPVTPTEAQGNYSNNSRSSAQGEDSARLDAEIEVSYELMQDDMIVAGASGLGAERDIEHYAMVYGQDGPVEIVRVTRQRIDRARASAETGGVKS